MNELPLEFYVNSITETLERSNQLFAEAVGDGTDPVKVSILYTNIGELHGELAFLRNSMKKEIDRKNKKFYKFWK